MADNIEKQIEELTNLINATGRDDELYYRRGKLYWKMGKRAESLTDFNTAIAINPESPASEYLKMLNDIMDFYNTDLYNP